MKKQLLKEDFERLGAEIDEIGADLSLVELKELCKEVKIAIDTNNLAETIHKIYLMGYASAEGVAFDADVFQEQLEEARAFRKRKDRSGGMMCEEVRYLHDMALNNDQYKAICYGYDYGYQRGYIDADQSFNDTAELQRMIALESKKIGKMIGEYLTEKKITINELANMVEESSSEIESVFESGQGLDTILYVEICEALGLPLDYFIRYMDESEV